MSFIFVLLDFSSEAGVFLLATIIPIKSYSNAEDEKDKILLENTKKSGIYMWKNKINEKRYIGSSQNLRKRLKEYFKTNHLLINTSMNICKALKKHGHSNFEFTILEYCEPSKCLEREKHYWGLLNPEYNIAKDPIAAMSGRNHSDKSKQIMSDIAKKSENSGRYKSGENHPNYGKNRDSETKQKISDTNKKIEHSGWFKTGHSHSDETKSKISDAMPTSIKIEVTDITNNNTTSYDSISEAARALNINKAIIAMYFSRNQQKPYKGIYTFKKVNK